MFNAATDLNQSTAASIRSPCYRPTDISLTRPETENKDVVCEMRELVSAVVSLRLAGSNWIIKRASRRGGAKSAFKTGVAENKHSTKPLFYSSSHQRGSLSYRLSEEHSISLPNQPPERLLIFRLLRLRSHKAHQSDGNVRALNKGIRCSILVAGKSTSCVLLLCTKESEQATTDGLELGLRDVCHKMFTSSRC